MLLGWKYEVFGDAQIPLITQITDAASINQYGEYQLAIVDKSITSVSEAQSLAKSEIRKWADGAWEAKFTTLVDGLEVGQQLNIQSDIRDIDQTYKINNITIRVTGPNRLEYSVGVLVSGEITFTDIMVGLLGQEKQNIQIDENEVLQRLINIDEEVDMNTGESVVLIKNSAPYTWGIGGSNDFNWDFWTWG